MVAGFMGRTLVKCSALHGEQGVCSKDSRQSWVEYINSNTPTYISVNKLNSSAWPTI